MSLLKKTVLYVHQYYLTDEKGCFLANHVRAWQKRLNLVGALDLGYWSEKMQNLRRKCE